MAIFTRDGTTIHYEESGAGFPVLLLAPGGLRSAIAAWDKAPWNPVEHLGPHYRVIAMDQRNAGGSYGPVRASDGWATYTADQLALLDHLGVDRFAVLGMCIGGSFIAGLVQAAPQRVAAAVALQPIGLDGNRVAFLEIFDGFAAEFAAAHPEATDAEWAGFREGLYGSDHTLFSVPDQAVAGFAIPILVLLGNDRFHPQSASRMLATAPNARLVQSWKEPEHHTAARAEIEKFLAEHTSV